MIIQQQVFHKLLDSVVPLLERKMAEAIDAVIPECLTAIKDEQQGLDAETEAALEACLRRWAELCKTAGHRAIDAERHEMDRQLKAQAKQVRAMQVAAEAAMEAEEETARANTVSAVLDELEREADKRKTLRHQEIEEETAAENSALRKVHKWHEGWAAIMREAYKHAKAVNGTAKQLSALDRRRPAGIKIRKSIDLVNTNSQLMFAAEAIQKFLKSAAP